MMLSTLEILRCPYCGGRLDVVRSAFHRFSDDRGQDGILGDGILGDGILGCYCCIFPVVDGIPVLHLLNGSTRARDQIQAGRPDLARRTMFGLESEAQAEVFDAVAASETATYRETVEALGPGFEGGYFLYRFSDPTFVVAQAVVRSVADVVLGGSDGRARRAIDVCGGSGHLTRSLVGRSPLPPVLADLYYAKIWLARRFTAPGCEPVCCDGNAPLPFARGVFGLAMCTDAFMYIWTKRQMVGELIRVTDAGGDRSGAVLIGHTHNERTWSPSHGQPLPPEGYAALFETLPPRLFAESGLFDDIVERGELDLSRLDTAAALDGDPALTIVATRDERVFTRHRIEPSSTAAGEFRLNPLYSAAPGEDPDDVRLRLRFPDEDYAQEYGACRRYLPDEVVAPRAALDALPATRLSESLAELARRRVVLDLPPRYY